MNLRRIIGALLLLNLLTIFGHAGWNLLRPDPPPTPAAQRQGLAQGQVATARPWPPPLPTAPALPAEPPGPPSTATPPPLPAPTPTTRPAYAKPLPTPAATAPRPQPTNETIAPDNPDNTATYRIRDPRSGHYYLLTPGQLQFFLDTGIILPEARRAAIAPPPAPAQTGPLPPPPEPPANPAAERTPTPPATPPAAGTAAPTPAADWADLRLLLEFLEQRDPAAARQIQDLPWLQDGIAYPEAEAVNDLIELALFNPDLHRRLHQTSWLKQDLPDQLRIPLLHYLNQLLSAADQEGLAARYAALLGQPGFLDHPDPWDADALQELYHLLRSPTYSGGDRLELHRRLLAQPSWQDGISEEEARALAAAGAAYLTPDHDRILRRLRPGGLHIETSHIETGPGRRIELTILRPAAAAPAAEPSPAMQDLKILLKQAMDYLDTPLPRQGIPPALRPYTGPASRQQVSRLHVAVYYTPDGFPAQGISGFNNGRALILHHRHDDNDPAARHVLAHEILHYWFHSSRNAPWINEGMAELLARRINRAAFGEAFAQNYPPCPAYPNARTMDDNPPGAADAGYSCAYGIGYRLFAALEQSLGAAPFREAVRNLYRDSLRTNLNYGVLRRHFPGSALEPAYGG